AITFPPLAADRLFAPGAAVDLPVLPGLLRLRRSPGGAAASRLETEELGKLAGLRAARPCRGNLVPAALAGTGACPARRHHHHCLAWLLPALGSSLVGAVLGDPGVAGGRPLQPAAPRAAVADPGTPGSGPLRAERRAWIARHAGSAGAVGVDRVVPGSLSLRP